MKINTRIQPQGYEFHTVRIDFVGYEHVFWPDMNYIGGDVRLDESGNPIFGNSAIYWVQTPEGKWTFGYKYFIGIQPENGYPRVFGTLPGSKTPIFPTENEAIQAATQVIEEAIHNREANPIPLSQEEIRDLQNLRKLAAFSREHTEISAIF